MGKAVRTVVNMLGTSLVSSVSCSLFWQQNLHPNSVSRTPSPTRFFLPCLRASVVTSKSLQRGKTRLHLVLHVALCLDSLLGMMTGYGVRGAFIVASRQHVILATINLVAAVAAVATVLSSPVEDALARRRHRNRLLCPTVSPSAQPTGDSGADADASGALLPTVGGDGGAVSASAPRGAQIAPETAAEVALVYPDRWPTRATLLALAENPRRREWVDAIRRAKEFRFTCEMCPKGLEPIRPLEAFMRHVRSIWAEAKAEDSALEPALGSALERLALVHARMAHRVRHEGGGLTSALEDALLDPSVLAGMRRRWRAQVRRRPARAGARGPCRLFFAFFSREDAFSFLRSVCILGVRRGRRKNAMSRTRYGKSDETRSREKKLT